MIRTLAAAALGLFMTAGASWAATTAELFPGFRILQRPDLQSNVDGFGIVGPLTFTDAGSGRGRLQATITAYDPFFGEFSYQPQNGASTEFSDASFTLDVEFDRLGASSVSPPDNVTASSNTFSISGVPLTTPSDWTGSTADPILTGALVGVSVELSSIALLWEVTGGRAAQAYGGHAVTLLSSSSIAYSGATGLSPFTIGDYNMDTKPAAVPVPAALPLAVSGLAAFGAARLRRRRG